MRTFRNSNHRAFYANHHNAASDVKVRLRDFSGVIQPGEFLLLGSSGIYAERTESAGPGGATVVEFQSRAVCNVVALVLEDVFGPVALYASDSLQKAMSGSDRGTVIPRVPRYTSADESQKVFWNPNDADPVTLTVNWEEMGKGGFLAGVHPGNNVLTMQLGTITPSAGLNLMFRVRPGRRFRVDGARLYTTSKPGAGTLTLQKSDETVLTSAPQSLNGLTNKVLTTLGLVAGAAPRTVGADEWLDIVVTAAGAGAAGNVTVELDYTLF